MEVPDSNSTLHTLCSLVLSFTCDNLCYTFNKCYYTLPTPHPHPTPTTSLLTSMHEPWQLIAVYYLVYWLLGLLVNLGATADDKNVRRSQRLVWMVSRLMSLLPFVRLTWLCHQFPDYFSSECRVQDVAFKSSLSNIIVAGSCWSSKFQMHLFM